MFPLIYFVQMKKVFHIYFNLILISSLIIELCCAMCYFMNLHPGHKLIRINDEKSLKNENISIEDSSKDLDDNKKKLEEL